MKYTLKDVSVHNKKDDCWIIINGGVYDITKFLPIHPGGQILVMSVAGKDATDHFNELHRPEILKNIGNDYLIGQLIRPRL
jgi:cytochrome b involved in lipid metabolism